MENLSETPCSQCDNSFLVECPKLSDISKADRLAIEKKFRRSNTNAKYVFPRSIVRAKVVKRKAKILPLRQLTILKARVPKETSLGRKNIHNKTLSHCALTKNSSKSSPKRNLSSTFQMSPSATKFNFKKSMGKKKQLLGRLRQLHKPEAV